MYHLLLEGGHFDERMQPLVNLLYHLLLEGGHFDEVMQPFVQGGRDVGGMCDV
jgi:hypothetical protein